MENRLILAAAYLIVTTLLAISAVAENEVILPPSSKILAIDESSQDRVAP